MNSRGINGAESGIPVRNGRSCTDNPGADSEEGAQASLWARQASMMNIWLWKAALATA